jgi:hypothetical protein
MPKEYELFTCPNPECHEKIEEPIVVSDVSRTRVERYYACPHCFIKLDEIFAQFLKQEEERKEEPSIKAPEKEKPPEKEKGSSKCAGYLGYLASLPEGEPIPRECLVCSKVLDCVMEAKDY